MKQHYTTTTDENDFHSYLTTISDMQLDISSFSHTYDNILTENTAFLTLSNIQKRSIYINGLGKAVRFLFGTADDGDLQTVKRNVKKIS
jgi:hypothetical protein